MTGAVVHRMLMTFDVTEWSESHRRRLAAAGANIAAAIAADLAAGVARHNMTDWTKESIQQLIGTLAAQGASTQAHTINEAIANGGEVIRERVYEIGEYDPGRSLKGFTRPIRRVVEQMKDRDLIPETALVPIEPIYDSAITGYQRTKGFRLIAGIVELYAEDGQTST